jgi:hypothetical protein
VALGQRLDGVGFGEQADLAGEDGVNAGAQTRPVGLRQIEMAAEVEQGDLTHLLAVALGGDQPVGGI